MHEGGGGGGGGEESTLTLIIKHRQDQKKKRDTQTLTRSSRAHAQTTHTERTVYKKK